MPFKNQHPLYSVWKGMIARCYVTSNHAYKDYGGRGIIVCERWRVKGQGFQNFLTDMGGRPEKTSLDRIDNNGNYEPLNCKWSTQKEQMRNRRVNVYVTIEGIKYLACELAEKYGFKTDTIIMRSKFCNTFAEVVDKKRRIFTAGLALGGKASGAKKKALTHCPSGHEYSHENTTFSKEGWRRCKECHRIKQSVINKRNKKQIIPKQYQYPKGVSKNGKKFQARYKLNGKNISFGTYETVLEASKAYEKGVLELQNQKCENI
jgi:hypothetical protein